jgi:hypothetical protein
MDRIKLAFISYKQKYLCFSYLNVRNTLRTCPDTHASGLGAQREPQPPPPHHPPNTRVAPPRWRREKSVGYQLPIMEGAKPQQLSNLSHRHHAWCAKPRLRAPTGLPDPPAQSSQMCGHLQQPKPTSRDTPRNTHGVDYAKHIRHRWRPSHQPQQHHHPFLFHPDPLVEFDPTTPQTGSHLLTGCSTR